ncbi:type II secretion system F family protein [Porticoccaceae bacterium]|nr:type II secretion system F family protein [Porticoccaceae bacterium]
MRFNYKALAPDGSTEQGELNCIDQQAAIEVISNRGWIPVDITLTQTGILAALNKPRFNIDVLSYKQLRDMTQQMATLLSAGVTLERSMMLLSSMTADRKMGKVLSELIQSIRQGNSLGSAMEAQNKQFPSFYISMVKAGEAGGTLEQVFSRLASYLKQSVEVREKIRSALIYPTLLMAMVIVTIVLLVTLILPQFETLFSQAETELPLATAIVMNVGGFIHRHGLLLLIAGILLSSLALWGIRQPVTQNILHRKILNIPILGSFTVQREFALLHRMIGILLQSGIPLAAALQISQQTLTNTKIAELLRHITTRVREGSPLSLEYSAQALVPPLAVELTRVGESSGSLGPMLIKSADIMDADTQQLIDRMMAILVPLLTIGMGLFIASIIGAVLVGIMSLNDIAY